MALKNDGPRKITVVLPNIDENGVPKLIKPVTVSDTLFSYFFITVQNFENKLIIGETNNCRIVQKCKNEKFISYGE